ncbi:DUF2188 domain-containing protein [Luteibacter yeojuensis]|uniref:DUF2188 domain-containing protein n=1 Tax=Luteibacter yeojuensis TaxID=345309 RepID=A0A0F3KUE6_9GAMM|nr:DUF2188 domain-containing protein [Luteibacter yeojuensis]KJV34786.1 hypothetical protein VI08_09370 [Luteibacter yeojuensis]
MTFAANYLTVFVLFPRENGARWRVVLPGGAMASFRRESEAMAHAFEAARAMKNRGRPVKVLRQNRAGTWIEFPQPVM